jgi:transposase InsO family protein
MQADASSTGLGACLMQDSQPVAYASRALTDPETRYAQIEREMLAIVFAAEQFHQYIYGNKVHVQSDHKPLEAIFQKSIHKPSPRLQLMLLRLLRYQLHVTFVPGSKMYIADTLSRAYLNNDYDVSDEQVCCDMRIHSVTASIPASPEKLETIREATKTDQSFTKLRNYVHYGWPTHKSSLPLDLQPYWAIRDEIHEEDGILFVGEKLIVPVSQRREILEKLHESHLGMDKCKARARDSLYWPNMTKDIEDMVARCATCATYKRKNQKEPLMPHSVPDRPWSKLGTDIFDFEGHDYLIVVDYHSKYPEVARLENKTASGVIKVMKPMFARHGIPDTLVSDNMPFASYTMREFARDWGFDIVTSSPTYPQSNGQSEKFVGTIKSLFRKAREDGRDPNIALLEYRNTPISGMEYSPAQLLMSRRLKDKIPTTSSLLRPAVVQDSQQMLTRRQNKQKSFYDRGAKSLPNHNIGDSVRVRLGKTWDRAIVTAEHSAPRSYDVTTESGQTYRRNQRFINRSPDQVYIAPSISDTVQSNNPGLVQSAASSSVPRSPRRSSVQSPDDVNGVNRATHSRSSRGVQSSDNMDSRATHPQIDVSPRRSYRQRYRPYWDKDYVKT